MTITKKIRQSLKDNSDDDIRQSLNRFFKKGEDVKAYGVKIPEVRKIGMVFFKQVKDFPKQDVFDLCEELWQSQYIEEAIVACVFSESLHAKYEPSDFAVFESWVRNYVPNWAVCDTLCNQTIGRFIMKYPEYIHHLKHWTKSSNQWVRRASAVTLIVPAKKGMFIKDIFEIADLLLLDDHDMVQKGYGWMLKCASQVHLKEVYNYVFSKKAIMPRTALRYAIEKMPENLRAEVMKK